LSTDFASTRAFFLGHAHRRFGTEFATAPFLVDNIVVFGLERIGELREFANVFFLDIRQGDASGRFLVHKRAKASFALENAKRHAHLAAEGRKPDDKLNGVDIVGNDDKLGLAGFDEGGDVFEAEFEHTGLGRFISFGFSGFFGLFKEALLLFFAGFRGVFGKKLEELGGSVFVESIVGKLSNHRGNFEAFFQDGALALMADISRPAFDTAQITSGLDALTDAKVAGGGFEEVGDGRLEIGGAVAGGLFGGGFLGAGFDGSTQMFAFGTRLGEKKDTNVVGASRAL
jgi:hypothetical protein